MKKIQFCFLFIFLFFSSLIKGQDIIRTKKDTISAKVVEIGLEEIKYRNFNNLDGPIIVIAKTDVIEITYENGTKFFLKQDPYDVNMQVAIRNKTHSIKFEFFSPLTNDIAFGYESMLKVGTNLEFKLAIIGLGTRPNTENASGLFLKGGVKFLKSPMYIQNGVKYAHGLNGAYIKPELIFNSYSVDKTIYTSNNSYPYTSTTELVHINYTNICVDIVFGKQYILGNAITLDYYVGFGYGIHISDHNTNSGYYIDESDYSYSHLYFGKNQ